MANPESTGSTPKPLEREAQRPSLMELFSAKSATISPECLLADSHLHSVLWYNESVHRARNISQKFAALERIAPRYAIGGSGDTLRRQAVELAAAYAELAADGELDAKLPCKILLRQIVSGLITLLADPRGAIELHLVTDQVLLPCDQRRALMLIASELVINALKYAFPDDAKGKIIVSLMADAEWISLTVQDDGIGLDGAEPDGGGTQIVRELSALLGGAVDQVSRGRGLRSQIIFKKDKAS